MNGFVLRLAALGLIALSAPAAAETELQAYLAAAKTFEGLKAEAAKTGDAPRLTDPRVRQTLAVLSNASGAFGSASFPFDDEAMQSDMCGVPVRTAFAYVYFGLEAFADEKIKEKRLSATSTGDDLKAALAELGERNTVRFQDEIFPLLAFQQRCLAAETPWLTSFLEKLPPEQMTDVRRRGLAGFRNGVKEMAMNAVGLLINQAVSEDNRRLMLASAARNLPALSGALTLDERAEAEREVEKLASGATAAYRADIAAIERILGDTRCEGLCRF